MSLILDALNRADRERNNSRVTPDINTIHEAGYRPATGMRNKARWIFAAAVILVVALLVFWLMQNPSAHNVSLPDSSFPDSSSPVKRLAESESTIGLTKNVKAGADAKPVDKASTIASVNNDVNATASVGTETPAGDEVRLLYQNESPASENVINNEVTEDHSTEGPEAVQTDINELYQEDEDPVVTESVPIESQPIVSVTSSTSNSTNKNYASFVGIPDLSELPWGVQQEIPSIRYSQHNFAAEGSSSVVINGRTQQAHNSIAPELRLEEIYVDGVLLRFRGHQFKLRALNNWINM